MTAFIPQGEYCYKIMDIIHDKEFGFKILTKLCYFYENGFCKKLNLDIDDQCKVCNINLSHEGE
jgi:hypothetical protein